MKQLPLTGWRYALTPALAKRTTTSALLYWLPAILRMDGKCTNGVGRRPSTRNATLLSRAVSHDIQEFCARVLVTAAKKWHFASTQLVML